MSSIFENQKITTISDNDFSSLEDKKISLNNKDCCIVLFHTDNCESTYVKNMLISISDRIIGTKILFCDLLKNVKIKDVIDVLAEDTNSSHWINVGKTPVISTYDNGKFVNFYTGNMLENEVLNYISFMSCSSE